MTDQQYSKHFSPDDDNEYKNQEFERGLAEWLIGFVQAYPHFIEKTVIDGVEIWILKLKI